MKATIEDLLRERWLRRRNAGEITWTTDNGDRIPINRMSDAYLDEAISTLEVEQLWKR